MDTKKATERPWRVVDRRRAVLKNIVIMSGQDNIVADMNDVHQRDPHGNFNSKRDNDKANAVDARGLANAELIVTAVTSYDAMREALKAVETALFAHAESGKVNTGRGQLESVDENLHPWIPGAKAWEIVAIVRAALAQGQQKGV